MTETYRGGRLPRDLPRGLRKVLENHDRLLARGIAAGDTTVIVQGDHHGTQAQSPVRHVLSDIGGNVNTLPIERAGRVLFIRFTGSPTLIDGTGNLRLSGNFTPQSADEVLGLVSDGTNWYEVTRGGSGHPTFVPAALWGAVPGAGNPLVAIQAALNECPADCTLYFSPGTYSPTGPLSCQRDVNIWAKGVIWDFGANLTAGQVGFTYGGSTARVERCTVVGLGVKRTYTNWASIYAVSATGISIYARSCQFEDLSAEGFDYGIVFDGAQTGGCDYNYTLGGIVQNCRYQLVLHQGGTGWVNENTFDGMRLTVTSALSADAALIVAAATGCKQMWLKWDEAAAGTNGINGNRFIGCALEPNAAIKVYRKVVLEGYDNYFLFCRWENNNTADKDITIGKAGVAVTSMTRNVFFHGDRLHLIVENDYVEFIGTTTTNNRNQFFTGWGSLIVGGNTKPTLTLEHPGSSTSTSFAVRRAAELDALRILAEHTTGRWGCIQFLDDSAAVVNSLSAKDSSPYDLVVEAGLDIGSVSQFRPSGSDLTARATNGANSIIFTGGGATAPPVKVANTGSSSYTALEIWDSALGYHTMDLKSGETGAALGVIVFNNASSVEQNRLYVPNSGQRSITVDKGFVANESGSDVDCRIEGNTDANLLYVDAGADSVGIGTATPGAKLHVAGGLRVDSSGTPALFIVDNANDGVIISSAGAPFAASDLIHIQGPGAMFFENATLGWLGTAVTTTPYTISGGRVKALYLVNTSTAKTINLPSVAAYYDQVIFKDSTGTAGTNNITIVPNGADTIDGAASYVIGVNWGSVTLIGNAAANWGVI